MCQYDRYQSYFILMKANEHLNVKFDRTLYYQDAKNRSLFRADNIRGRNVEWKFLEDKYSDEQAYFPHVKALITVHIRDALSSIPIMQRDNSGGTFRSNTF